MYLDDHVFSKMKTINDFNELNKFIKSHNKVLNRYKDGIVDKIEKLTKNENYTFYPGIIDRLLLRSNGDITETQFLISYKYANSLVLTRCPDYHYFDLFILLLDMKSLEKNERSLKYNDLVSYKEKLTSFLNMIYDLYIPMHNSRERIQQLLEKHDYSLVEILNEYELSMVKEFFNNFSIDLKFQAIRDYWYYHNITGNFLEEVYKIADRYEKYIDKEDTVNIIYNILLEVKYNTNVELALRRAKEKVVEVNKCDIKIFDLLILDISQLIFLVGDIIQYNQFEILIKKKTYDSSIDEDDVASESVVYDYTSTGTHNDVLEYVMEAQKKSSVKMQDAQKKIYGAFKKYKNAEDKVDSQITSMTQSLKGLLIGDVRTEIVEGKKMTAIGALKTALKTAAIFSFGPIKGLVLMVVQYALKKDTKVSERKKIILELEAELELIEEKIEDARGDGNRQAKYAMMRTRTEIVNAIKKIKLGLEADQRSIDTAKKLINK